MSLQQDRRRFNTQTAPVLAERVGVPGLWNGHGSERFAYFCDDQRLVIVAGPQEGSHVDLAFAHGLEHRGSRRLVLILPRDGINPCKRHCAAQETTHVQLEPQR